MPFQMYITPLFGEITGEINLSKSSPSMANLCESLRQLRLSKTERPWNVTYNKLFDKVKSIIKEGACMKFYNETQPLYLETDACGVRLQLPYYKPEVV